MAHCLTNTDAMFTVREPAWHDLGHVLPEHLTAEEAMQLVCNWEVEQHALMTQFGVPVSHKANIRSDNGAVLGVVGPDYTPLQNAQAFGFFDAVTGTGEAKYETAGTLHGGKKVWMLAKTSSVMEVVPGDVVEEYLLLSNSHDGSSAVRMLWTPTRVVCQNTLTAALNGNSGKTSFKARHTSGVMARVTEAQDILGLARKHHDQTLAAYSHMAETRPTEEEVKEVLERLFPEREDAVRDTWTEPRFKVRELYDSSETCNLQGMEETGWGLYNALTEFNQYYRRDVNAERRFESSYFDGTIAEQNAEALQAVLAVC
jgi:phage/plasmid-like protein (TIGR03299 family)